VQWTTHAGPDDLPCFVERDGVNTKASFWGRVRMETPVLYFYAQQQTVASVDVRFRNGIITEWFPPATVVPAKSGAPLETSIAWKHVTVRPGAGDDFPREKGSSHYYAARETDASPIASGSAREKFLFYRGVGQFAPPIAAKIEADGRIAVRGSDDGALGDIVRFERRGEEVAYEIRHIDGSAATFGAQAPYGTSPALQAELEQMLIAAGLYAREAQAMVRTWRDSWFEEGSRIFYIVPKRFVDSALPLRIDPMPLQVSRAFVGRVELITPEMERAVRAALNASDRAALAKYGRFVQPIGDRILAAAAPSERARFQRLIQSMPAPSIPAASCR